jgi:hypothetical protein
VPRQAPVLQTLADNALLRCGVHRVSIDREARENMVLGEGQVSGTAQQGGRMRQLTTRVPGDPADTPKDVPPAR